MSKINEIKKQNPGMEFNIIDALNNILPKTKYVELMLNLIKNDDNLNSSKLELQHILKEEFGMDFSLLKEMTFFEILSYYRFYSEYLTKSKFDLIKKFIDLNEKNLINKNDLTSYQSFDEIEKQVSLSELKLINKEFDKQIIRLHETNEWLLLKPLSWQASKKYGAGTKWCTAMEYDSDHFYRYVKSGLLIYCINKLTGDKFAIYKSLKDFTEELSFWNIKDNRVDSMELDIPDEIFIILRQHIKISVITNWDLLTDEEKDNQLQYAEPYSRDLAETYVENPNRGRIIRFMPPTEVDTINLDVTFTPGAMEELTDEFENEVKAELNKFLFRENTPQLRQEIATTLINKFELDGVEFEA